MPFSRDSDVDVLIAQTLLSVEAVVSELRKRIASRAVKGETWRHLLDRYQEIIVDTTAYTDVAAWTLAVQDVAAGLPLEPLVDPLTDLFDLGDTKPLVRLRAIDEAVRDLQQRVIVSKAAFRELDQQARMRAFTVARLDSDDAIATVRNILAQQVEEGPSLRAFRKQVVEALEGSRIGPAHLENVYRTNIQAAYRAGHERITSNPIVQDVFPYRAYWPIRDDLARDEHLALEKLGLNGTNIYRTDDPMWRLFLPPWGYQCRCSVTMLTLQQAAERGVKEAARWIRSGEPPLQPEWRLEAIPFRPDHEWV